MSKSHMGVKFSEEHCINIGISLSGDKNGNYGRKFSDEHIAKLSESRKGIKHGIPTEEHRRNLSEAQYGDKHPGWKGEEVGMATLHAWMRKTYPPPKECINCGEEKPLDIHNISGEYRREISDWVYLCRKCHQITDGRYAKLMDRNYNNASRLKKECVN